MSNKNLTRRDFNALSAAAMGGILAAGAIGCTGGAKPAATPPAGDQTSSNGDSSSEETSTVAKHACRGLNECKGQGKTGENDCAGSGQCAAKSIHHVCAGHNDCKNQGGCGDTPGANECAGKGGCAVPMEGSMWEKARKLFEERMEEKGVEVHPAPAA